MQRLWLTGRVYPVGANLVVQTRRGQVMRVLPRVNEAVNECWLADRDR